mgnify:FL=1
MCRYYIMNKQKKEDIKMGLIGENNVMDMINNYLCIEAKPTKYWCPVDMEDEHNCIEIKTRRSKSDAYQEFFFNNKKTKYAEKKEKALSIVYNLLDGVFLFDYTKYQNKTRVAEKIFNYRGKEEKNMMCYCPTEYFEYIGKIET